MPYIQISNFKFGLDTRRSELTSQPGTLLVANNVHINQGGEVEKRKAFAVFGGAALPAACFGLEVTTAGLVTFGSAAAPGGMPAGVTYIRLRHPDLATAMSALVWSTQFNGKAWAIALFADGNRYAYYDGTIVPDFLAGQVLAGLNTNVLRAQDFALRVNQSTLYTATQRANPNDDQVDVFGPLGALYGSTVTETAAGTLVAQQIDTGTPPVAAAAASGGFTILGGSANAANKITAVKVNGVTVTNAAVLWTTSNEATAALIASSINTKTSVPDYTATASGATVQIVAVTADAATNNFVVEVDAEGNVTIGDCLFAISGTLFSLVDIQADGVSLLTTKPVAYPGAFTALSALVTSLVADINAGTTAGLTHGYVAFGYSNNIRISKAVTKSSDSPINVFVSITPGAGGTGGVGTGTTQPLLVTAAPANIGYGSSTGSGNSLRIMSKAVIGAASGGVGPYTYHWAYISGTLGTGFVTNTPNSYTTTFSAYNRLFLNTGTDAIFRAKVTDSTGAVSFSGDVNVKF